MPRFKIMGWLSDAEVSATSFADGVLVRATAFHGPEKWRESEYHRDKLDTDSWVAGTIRPSGLDLVAVLQGVLGAQLT